MFKRLIQRLMEKKSSNTNRTTLHVHLDFTIFAIHSSTRDRSFKSFSCKLIIARLYPISLHTHQPPLLTHNHPLERGIPMNPHTRTTFLDSSWKACDVSRGHDSRMQSKPRWRRESARRGVILEIR